MDGGFGSEVVLERIGFVDEVVAEVVDEIVAVGLETQEGRPSPGCCHC